MSDHERPPDDISLSFIHAFYQFTLDGFIITGSVIDKTMDHLAALFVSMKCYKTDKMKAMHKMYCHNTSQVEYLASLETKEQVRASNT